jgi:RNA polymerase sigma factor (sigma-70 family)
MSSAQPLHGLSKVLDPEMTREISDRQLLDRFVAEQDESAFVALVQRYSRSVWGVCRRLLFREQDAEDAFQAVFLVLARKAGSIRDGEAVGSWLYGVAYRTALKARQLASKRSALEKKAGVAKEEPSPVSEAAWRELQRQLDEELQALPEKYKAPFVLCCLEGMSRADAARELGWKEGTLSSRLSQARKLLQTRLARRGVVLSAVLTAMVLSQGAASAAPAALVETAALTLHAEATSCATASLAESMLSTMGAAKLKAAIGLAVTLTALLGTATALAAFTQLPQADPEPKKAIVLADTFVPPPVLLGKPTDERVLGLAFSPDGKKLVTAGARHGDPGQLKIWDAVSGAELARVRGFVGARCVAFSPKGTIIATGHFGGMLRLRDPATGAETESIQAHDAGVNGLAFSPEGDLLATAGLDRTVKVFDVKGLRERKVLRGHTDMVYSVDYFHNGKFLVTGGNDKTAIIWDLAKSAPKFILKGHKAPIESVAVSADDQIVATASWDRTIKLWNAETGAEIGTLGGKSKYFAVALSPKGELLASGSEDGIVTLWDVKSRKPLNMLGRHNGPVWSVMFSNAGDRLASGSNDKTAKIWDVAKGTELLHLNTSENRPVFALAYAPDGKAIAVAGDDRAVRLLEPQTGDLQMKLQGHTMSVNAVAFASDGLEIASGSADQTVIVWSRATGRPKHTLKGHIGVVRAVAISPDGKRIASGGDDRVIKIWDRTSGDEITAFDGHRSSVTSLVFAPDGEAVVSGDDAGNIRVSYFNKQLQAVNLQVSGAVRALAFHGTSLACASSDGTLKIWPAAPGTPWKASADKFQTLANPLGGLLCLTFTRNGALVAGGRDGSIAIWDLATGRPRHIWKGHKTAVTALAIHPQGENLISGAAGGALLRWRGAQASEEIKVGAPPEPIIAVHTPPTRVEVSGDPDEAPEGVAPAGGRRRGGWLIALIVAMLMFTLAILAGVVAIRWRKSKKAQAVVGDDRIVVQCAACDRNLTVKFASAGKKVRCPCGASVVVPPDSGFSAR